MRWRGGRESDNVEDRRGMPGGPVMVTGGIGTLLLIVLALYLGVDPQALLQGQPGGGPQLPGPAAGPDGAGAEEGGPEDELKQFVRVVLADTEDVWQKQFRELGRTYRDPTLVLFNGQVQSACGFADAAVGPFYCPARSEGLFGPDVLSGACPRFRAPGEFAQAYVIAHEIGHHVQNQLGISDKVSNLRGRVSQSEYNQMSVRLELQADFLAGMWAHHAHETRRILEAGDVEAALTAASAIGDDRLQRQTQGRVVPDSFTHGTSAQRVRWFRKGLQSGKLDDGDTFNADEL